MFDVTTIALIPLLPLLSFLLIGLAGRKYFPKLSGYLGTLSLFAAFALSCFIAYQYFFIAGKSDGVYQKIAVLKYAWLQFSQDVSIDMGLLLDPISVMMIVVVTFISFMVHLYSLGYMKEEKRFATYFSFLSLFTFSMLGLVLSSNIFQIYVFWELVGVSSFLLIGFYYEKPSAVAASKKAFIVTRFADLGFLIGILVLSFQTGTLDFQTLIQRATSPEFLQTMAGVSFIGLSALTWGLLLVFMGCAGKSAMFPLHVWLPDAMEGPTPVSALIHAATMVVAGVYLVARLFPVFNVVPIALDVVTYTGLFSALFAAVIACTQTDIKRVLAYSTMSQIGFMMFSLGVSGYGENGLGYMASMFHLFTHAIFKALLFLGAGAVIHYVHSNEMKDMGGLRKSMPVTHITFLVACLAISGIPPFSGFFSKEEILAATWHADKLVFVVAVITSMLTAFYMFRLYFNIFWNKNAVSTHHHHEEHKEKHHEGTLSMLLPLVVLAILTVATGFVPFHHLVTSDGAGLHTEFHLSITVIAVSLAIGGIMLATAFYRKESALPDKVAAGLGKLYSAAHNKFYVDELYLFITKKILFKGISEPAAWIDRNIIDGSMNGIAKVTDKCSHAMKGLQSGRLQDYAIYFLAGVIGLVLLFTCL